MSKVIKFVVVQTDEKFSALSITADNCIVNFIKCKCATRSYPFPIHERVQTDQPIAEFAQQYTETLSKSLSQA